ncbi:Punt [Strongyloides ratti]|uniref:receptor protein serine/threonine kinase n=1 Tax=Strongyloides ratti TaxID=34506 RepID=A0A090LED9_STRRB|nr:Punt [Strongyloides ratti]CEF65875.1 Punt [Strongyloides ratti]
MSKKNNIKLKKENETINNYFSQSKFYFIFLLIIALLLSVCHSYYLSLLYENDIHFSYLADFEREMAYRTEMGLYFSYYKTIVKAESFVNGLEKIIYDNVTEYGHEINTLNRFNLYPEVILGFLYRNFKNLNDIFKFTSERCYQTNRGGDLPPITSCEGILNYHYFYIYGVFGISGTVAGSIFLIGCIISETFFGGLISFCCFMFNHSEATRVQWTPPLRESFGYPMILLQMLILTVILKWKLPKFSLLSLFTIFTTSACLFWQFSQFVFFTQVFALYILYLLAYVPRNIISSLIYSHLMGFIISYILLFGNDMMLTSLYLTSLLSFIVIFHFLVYFESHTPKIISVPLRLLLFVILTLGLKYGISNTLNIEDDSHIFDIVKSKFSDFANFHTRLYTCAAEFDFITMEPITKISITLLFPTAIVGFLLVIFYVLKKELFTLLKPSIYPLDKSYCDIIYHALQSIAFCILACLIMRLKLFATPHLCILAGGSLNTFFWPIKLKKIYIYGIIFGLIGCMGFKGIENVQKELSKIGEYSNPDQEFVFEWIKYNTKENDVFAGPMPLMANVKLSTLRPIANHPHYEHVEIRNRTLKVYSVFSKKAIVDVYNTLKNMGINYFLFQPHNCMSHPTKAHCSYRTMWDLQDPDNINNINNCELIEKTIQTRNQKFIEPFELVYNQKNYVILKFSVLKKYPTKVYELENGQGSQTVFIDEKGRNFIWCESFKKSECLSGNVSECTVKKRCYRENYEHTISCSAAYVFDTINRFDFDIHNDALQAKGCWSQEHAHLECLDIKNCILKEKIRALDTNKSALFCCCFESNCNSKEFLRYQVVTTQEDHELNKSLVKKDNFMTQDKLVHTHTTIILALFFILCTFILLCSPRIVRNIRKNINETKEKEKSSVSLEIIDNGKKPLLVEKEKPRSNHKQIDIIEILARGRFGEVYKGIYNGQIVAVKTFNQENAASWIKERDIFTNEFVKEHDSIVKYLGMDYIKTENCVSYRILLQYHEKGSLNNYLHNHKLTFYVATKMMMSIINGICYLHGEINGGDDSKPTIIHNDIKSKNILVKDDLSCCISDFGLSTTCLNGRMPSDEVLQQVGTKRYMAPEILEGATEFSAFAFLQVDIYGAALVLWEILSRTFIPEMESLSNIPKYILPYEDKVGMNPTIGEMRNLVVMKKIRPEFNEYIFKNTLSTKIVSIIEDMWDSEPHARISAGCAKSRMTAIYEQFSPVPDSDGLYTIPDCADLISSEEIIYYDSSAETTLMSTY